MPSRPKIRSQLVLMSLGALSLSAGLAYQAHAEPRANHEGAPVQSSPAHYAKDLMETADEFERTLVAHDERVLTGVVTATETAAARQQLNAQFHELFEGLNVLELNGKAIEADIIRTQLENAIERHMESNAANETLVTRDINQYSRAFTESYIAYASLMN